MESIVYMNGTFRPDSEAVLSVRSRALNYGLGCFAGIRGYRTDDGSQVNVFRLDRHLRRLEQSARILGLRLSGSAKAVEEVIVELLRRNQIREDVYIRPLVYADSNALSPILDPDSSAIAIYCLPLGRYLSTDPIDVSEHEMPAQPRIRAQRPLQVQRLPGCQRTERRHPQGLG